MKGIMIFLMVCLATGMASADLYKCVDENGVTHYSNTPVIKKSDEGVKVYKEAESARKGHTTRGNLGTWGRSDDGDIIDACIKKYGENDHMLRRCIAEQKKTRGNLNKRPKQKKAKRSPGVIPGPEHCQGCCSHHGGTVCNNGVTECADGTPLSGVCTAKGCDEC